MFINLCAKEKPFKPNPIKNHMEKINKNNFIELEFTAKIKDGEIFDTNIKADAKKLNIKDPKPLIISVGHSMIIKGIDEFLEGKQINKQYEETFSPEKAFGKRNPQLIKMIPLRAFKEQNIEPQTGMQLNLDGQLVRIASASGGRILVDFNNPLAGKAVTYKFKAKRKIINKDEKINALQDFFFRKRFPFTTKEKTITFKTEKNLQPFIEMMSKPFKEILDMDVKIENKKQEKKPASKK